MKVQAQVTLAETNELVVGELEGIGQEMSGYYQQPLEDLYRLDLSVQESLSRIDQYLSELQKGVHFKSSDVGSAQFDRD